MSIAELEAAGIELPADVQRVRALTEALREAARDVIGLPDAGAAATAYAPFLDRLTDLDPKNAAKALDAAAHDAAAAAHRRDIWNAAAPTLTKMLNDAALEAADTIIEDSRRRFEAAAQAFRPAAEAFGPHPETMDAHDVIEQDRVDEWRQALEAKAELTEAAAVVAALTTGETYLNALHRYVNLPAYYTADLIPAVYLADDLSPEAFDQAVVVHTEAGIAGLVHAGYRLTLRTADETRQLIEAVDTDRTPDTGHTTEPEAEANRLDAFEVTMHQERIEAAQ